MNLAQRKRRREQSNEPRKTITDKDIEHASYKLHVPATLAANMINMYKALESCMQPLRMGIQKEIQAQADQQDCTDGQ